MNSLALSDMYRVEQHFRQPAITDVAAAVREQFARFDVAGRVHPGERVAVAVASRGTHDLAVLVKTTLMSLVEMGLKPHIIPAMGSHGGGTGEGQRRVLKGLGIDEASMGFSVEATSEAVQLGTLDSGAPVFFARDALGADHLMVINRVKPHTAFRSDVESGLCKMLAVGCGRRPGAESMHKYDLARTIVPAAQHILAQVSVLGGLAVTETASGGTHSIRLVGPAAFVETDRELLVEAWSLLPRLPIDDLDILVVDEMGKDISGAGMDPNVIGFWRREGGERRPDYRCLIVLDLTAASHGNAHGIGMADLTTRRVLEGIDRQATTMNALTSGVLRAGRLPIAMENDRQAIDQALRLQPDPSRVRMARIISTAALDAFWVSPALVGELSAAPDITVAETPLPMRFDTSGRLQPA